MEASRSAVAGAYPGCSGYASHGPSSSHDLEGVSRTKPPVGFESWNLGDRYRIIRALGKGSYGIVAEAIDMRTGQRVAVKRMQNVFEQKTGAKRMFRELRIMRSLTHNNTVRLLDVVCPRLDLKLFYHHHQTQDLLQDPSSGLSGILNNRDECIAAGGGEGKNKQNQKTGLMICEEDLNDLYLVMEFVDTDLYKLLNSAQYLSTAHIQTFMHQILLGVSHMHQNNVVHRDLKPANILVNEDCSLKLCDFGLSRAIDRPEPRVQLPCVSTSSRSSGSSACTSPCCRDDDCDESSPTGCTGTGAGGRTLDNIDNSSCCSNSTSSSVCSESLSTSSSSSFDAFAPLPPAAAAVNSSSSYGSTSYNPIDLLATLALSELDSINNNSNSNIYLNRQFTRHVVTRWYRPPEVILLQSYTTAADMWSAGCILAELLGMQQENVGDVSKRSALFPGQSCYPLSWDGDLDLDPSVRDDDTIPEVFENGERRSSDETTASSSSNSNSTKRQKQSKKSPNPFSRQFIEQMDQLNVILDAIGSPSDDDLRFIEDLETLQYVQSIPPKHGRHFRGMFPGAHPGALDLLQRMLQFNPEKRITAEEALRHPFITSFSSLEAPENSMASRVSMPPMIIPFNVEEEKMLESPSNLFENIIREIVLHRHMFARRMTAPAAAPVVSTIPIADNTAPTHTPSESRKRLRQDDNGSAAAVGGGAVVGGGGVEGRRKQPYYYTSVGTTTTSTENSPQTNGYGNGTSRSIRQCRSMPDVAASFMASLASSGVPMSQCI